MGRVHKKYDFMRSGLVTTAVLGVALLIVLFFFHERGKGHLHQLTTPATVPLPPSPAQPGGKDPITLTRLQILNGAAPEITSATVLPGLGMKILQLQAEIPLKGTIPLFAAGSVDEAAVQAANVLEGKHLSAAEQARALAVDGAPMLVWTSKNSLDTDDPSLAAITLQAPENPQNNAMPDGGDATAVLNAIPHPTAGQLPAGIELRISTLMSGHSLELTMTAQNTGTNVVPLRLGWMPHLALPIENRARARLLVPSSEEMVHGKQVSAHGTDRDFSAPKGALLGKRSIDATYTHLQHDFLSNGAQIDLQNPDGGYTLRFTALSPNIRAVRVLAPADAPWIAILPIADSMDTPDNRRSDSQKEGSARGLAPGKTFQWKLRLEVLQPLQTGDSE